MKKTLTILIGSLMLLAALVIPVLHSALAKPAPAEHPEYRDAIEDLRKARKHLEGALDDGYGHRDRAMRAIDESIKECEAARSVLH
ncbi:MAG: hypothetical protein ACLQOO_12535 [Terriglobia bacterium]